MGEGGQGRECANKTTMGRHKLSIDHEGSSFHVAAVALAIPGEPFLLQVVGAESHAAR